MALELLLSNHYADCLAPCKLTCPAGVDVQGYISLIEKGLYNEALALIKETNPLPAVCGRVCVRPCEAKCRRQLIEDTLPVGIDYLKRYVSDLDLASATPYQPKQQEPNGKKVAIIGGGPAGLSAAYYLQLSGFQADIYESQPMAGGWLRYGIPEYRLPNAVLDQEIANITKLGVQIFTQKEIGKNIAYSEIEPKYDALFLAIGAQDGDLLGIGEKPAPNLVAGIDFLKRNAETDNDTDLKNKKVVVIGGGNTAMDCCRSARRCGSTDVIVLYRRTEADMPANPIEIHESKIEGVKYILLAAPVDVYYDEQGNLTGLKCIKMKAEKQPGASRSTIVPIEGSEFDLPCYLVLPATGQKIQYPVLDHINDYYKTTSLQLNKWKTLDPNLTTFQMNIPKVFAAGDAVTGAANIIQAIAGGKAAAKYMAQFIMGEPFEYPVPPFVSTKDNFEKQKTEDYKPSFARCLRYEMPVLDEDERHNFSEVELGYQEPELIQQEAERCLECGCSAFYDCKLQEYATRYGAVQKHYQGGYQKFDVNFQHPQIEIDSNKCILCGRCVRVCREYSGNKAWEFFQRGAKTCIAPNMEGKLMESRCDACGLCIDTCPTGALRENFKHKTLPLPFEKLPVIDPFGSEGFEVNLLAYKGNIYGATSREGIVNQYGLINRDIKFGYSVFNRKDRITKPMIRENGRLVPATVEQVIERIKQAVQNVESKENVICVSPNLTNESMYMIQKWGRAGIKTNAIGSLSHIDKSVVFNLDKNDNLPLHELAGTKHIFILSTDLSLDHPVINHLVQNSRYKNNTPVTFITKNRLSQYLHKADEAIFIKDEEAFLKAINYHLISQNKAFGIFIDDFAHESDTPLALHYDTYKKHILQQDYRLLLETADVDAATIEKVAQTLINVPESAVIVSETSISESAFCELKNLMLLTEKQGKPSAGMMYLKAACNSQGLYDMGIFSEYGPGFRKIEGEYLELLKKVWKTEQLSLEFSSPKEMLTAKAVKNIFIFNENPMEEHPEVADFFKKTPFVCVQTPFENETTVIAQVVLPMNFAIETGGSFTNTFKIAQNFEAVRPCPFGWNDYQFYAQLSEAFGVSSGTTDAEAFLEMISLLQPACCSGSRHQFEIR